MQQTPSFYPIPSLHFSQSLIRFPNLLYKESREILARKTLPWISPSPALGKVAEIKILLSVPGVVSLFSISFSIRFSTFPS